MIRAAQAADAGTVTPATFTGRGQLRPLQEWTTPATDKVSLVSFQPGARTHWHEHEHGQLLVVTAGGGFVAVDGEDPVRIEAGDLVIAESGERHWHGAASDAGLTHLAVSRGLTTWFGPADEDGTAPG